MNFEYDGYLQRVLQSIVTSYSMKFQMVSAIFCVFCYLK